MGGKGGIVALGGIESNVPAIERKAGLDAGARRQSRTSSSSTSRSPTGRPPRRSRRPTPGSPSSATRSAASGRPMTTWRSPRSRRCAPTAAPARCRSPASTASSSRSKRSSRARWPARSPGIRSGRAAWACRSATTPRPASSIPSKEPKEHREFYGTGVVITARERPGVLRQQHQGRAEARLERHLGPRQRPDPVQLSRARGRARRAAPPPARPHAAERAAMSRDSGVRRVTTLATPQPTLPPAAGRSARGAGGSPPGRRSSCSSLLCAIIAVINPNFLTFGNFVRISQAAMIPLVLGLGATFIILMGSIDLSVEGVLTLGGGDPVDAGAERRQRQRSRPARRRSSCCSSAPASASSTASSTSACKIPSFMTTLGTWFIGVGVANALLGGMAIRINDPMIRGARDRALPRLSLGRLAGARLPRRRLRHPELHAARPLHLRARRRRGAGGALRHPGRPRADRRPSPRRRLLRHRRHPRGRPARPRQRPDRQRAAVHHHHRGRRRRHRAVRRRRAACCRRWSAC